MLAKHCFPMEMLFAFVSSVCLLFRARVCILDVASEVHRSRDFWICSKDKTRALFS